MANGQDFQRETERAKRQYELYDLQGMWQTSWAPFNELEAAYRCQQQMTFGALMRQIGRRDLAGLRILDVGCGLGRILRTYIDMGAEPNDLFGIDLSENYINIARRLAPHLHLSVTDGITLDFPDASFDLVTQYVVFSSISLIELRQQLANEMWRVLKPGGYIFWWDMLHMAAAAGGHDRLLELPTAFANKIIEQVLVSATAKPSVTLKPFRGAVFIGHLIDMLGKPPTHVAALIGPKD